MSDWVQIAAAKQSSRAMDAATNVAPQEKLLACVHCGLCLQACPTYVEDGAEADSPRGRIHLMRALEEGRFSPTSEVVRHLDLCLGCRACETACPSGVEYGVLIESTRAYVERNVRRPMLTRWKRRVLSRFLIAPSKVGAWRPLFSFARRLRVPALAGAAWLPLRMRRMAALVPRAQSAHVPHLLEPVGEHVIGTVALLAGCVSRALFARVNELSARLLALAGYRVVVPGRQGCCGALSAHLGEEDEARRLARGNVNAFLVADVDWIATNAAGCGAMMRDYGRLLGGDSDFAAAAVQVAAKARDVTVLLDRGRLPDPARRDAVRIAYHDACHLAHGQGVREEPRRLLRSIPGVELVELAEDLCCGSAGTYNLTEPKMAWRLAERKARAILDTGAAVVAAGNPGCILQIQAALRMARHEIPVLHPVEILAAAYGIETAG